MEEVKNNTPPKKKKKDRGADFAIKILSLILAIVAWFVLSITQYPTISKTITKVPVTFSMDGTTAEQKGLSPINYKEIQVDVEIKGMNYEIGNYTANDLVATINPDKVTTEGTYQLDIDVKSSHSADKCTIVSVSPSTVTVNFDRIAEKTIKLDSEAPYVRAKEGLTLRDTGNAVTPSEITVKGPKNLIDNIDKAVAKISKSVEIAKDSTFQTDEVVFYDADDNEIDSSKLEILGSDKFDVNFTVYKKKIAKLKVNISGCPDNFDVNSLPLVMSEKEISVISPNLKDKDEEILEVGTIDLSSIDLTNREVFDVKLGDGEVNLNGTDKVTVTFDSRGYTSKKFTIPQKNIIMSNTPIGLSAQLETDKLTNVVVYGPEDIVSKLKSSDLYAKIDLSDVVDKGSYTRNAVVYSPISNKVWSYGGNEVQFIVKQGK